MSRFVLSAMACLAVIFFTAHAVDPVPAAASPAGVASPALGAAAAADSPAPLDGFSGDSAREERDWESKFRALPSPENLRSYMQRLSARPHHVGTEYDRANAEWILSLFKQWGWDAHIENFDVLFPTPKERLVELLAPTHFKATLEEPTVAVDPTSNQHSEQLPTYNAYSVDGDVTAPLVYVNYGIPADYEELDRLGVSVKGAIVLARYGMSWRGIKPKVAAEHGAVGCIIYSDPHEDGYFRGDVFPTGAWRPLQGVQRGSVMDMVLYPGDPLTPGVGATKDAKRLPAGGGQDHHQDSRSAHLLRRRAAAARRPARTGGPGSVARLARRHLPHWARPRPSALKSEGELGHQNPQRWSSARFPARLLPTSGLCAATTRMPG